MDKTYKVTRKRAGNFKVNCPSNGKIYSYLGSKKKFRDIKDIDKETYLWLVNSTSTFSDGELVLEEEEDKKELDSQLYDEDKEKIKNHTHSREEIEVILKGNTNAMKALLGKIELIEEKSFVMTVAEDIKLDSVAKNNFLNEWIKPKKTEK